MTVPNDSKFLCPLPECGLVWSTKTALFVHISKAVKHGASYRGADDDFMEIVSRAIIPVIEPEDANVKILKT